MRDARFVVKIARIKISAPPTIIPIVVVWKRREESVNIHRATAFMRRREEVDAASSEVGSSAASKLATSSVILGYSLCIYRRPAFSILGQVASGFLPWLLNVRQSAQLFPGHGAIAADDKVDKVGGHVVQLYAVNDLVSSAPGSLIFSRVPNLGDDRAILPSFDLFRKQRLVRDCQMPCLGVVQQLLQTHGVNPGA